MMQLVFPFLIYQGLLLYSCNLFHLFGNVEPISGGRNSTNISKINRIAPSGCFKDMEETSRLYALYRPAQKTKIRALLSPWLPHLMRSKCDRRRGTEVGRRAGHLIRISNPSHHRSCMLFISKVIHIAKGRLLESLA